MTRGAAELVHHDRQSVNQNPAREGREHSNLKMSGNPALNLTTFGMSLRCARFGPWSRLPQLQRMSRLLCKSPGKERGRRHCRGKGSGSREGGRERGIASSDMRRPSLGTVGTLSLSLSLSLQPFRVKWRDDEMSFHMRQLFDRRFRDARYVPP